MDILPLLRFSVAPSISEQFWFSGKNTLFLVEIHVLVTFTRQPVSTHWDFLYCTRLINLLCLWSLVCLKRTIISTSKFRSSRLGVAVLPPVTSFPFHQHPCLCCSSSVPVCQCPYSVLWLQIFKQLSIRLTALSHTHKVLSKLWVFIRNVYPAVAQSMLAHSCWDFASLLAGQLCTSNFWFSVSLQKKKQQHFRGWDCVWAPDLPNFSAFKLDKGLFGAI